MRGLQERIRKEGGDPQVTKQTVWLLSGRSHKCIPSTSVQNQTCGQSTSCFLGSSLHFSGLTESRPCPNS